MIKRISRPFPAIYKFLQRTKRLFIIIAFRLKTAVFRSMAWLRYCLRCLISLTHFRAFLNFSKSPISRNVFAQGLRTKFGSVSMWLWNALVFHRTIALLINGDHISAIKKQEFARLAKHLIGAEFSECNFDSETFGVEVLSRFPNHAVILLDGKEQLPSIYALIQLKNALYRYGRARRIAVVVPRVINPAGASLSLGISRSKGTWQEISTDQVKNYQQHLIPKYVLAGRFHSAFFRREAIVHLTSERTSTPDAAFALWCQNAIQKGSRLLQFSPAGVDFKSSSNLEDLSDPSWYLKRECSDASGKLKIIFVLPATTISGGIRAVLEKAETLLAQGQNVEVWALGPTPQWTEISYQVREFKNYASLTDALSLEHGLKVATWWETIEPVFLGSLNRGIPVQYVQEFETWFYPNNPTAQAAVVSSYRPEFEYTTTASYQQQELHDVGIDAPIIPPAYDAEIFKHNSTEERESNTLLALGRSFFQKNFALTAHAWRSLGESRPNFWLYGFEPDLVRDPLVTYHVRPSDKEIARLYQTATAFIQTSFHEGFSLPVLEAMASGCPVIVTDAHGNRDFCFDEENCLMVPNDDYLAVGAAIKKLIDDPQLQRRLSVAGLETAKRYTWTRVAEETVETYQTFADKAARC